jgi:hypothetical protein
MTRHEAARHAEILALGLGLLLFLPAFFWLERTAELCRRLEDDHTARYKRYADFLVHVVGMGFSGTPEAPAFRCPRSFGFGAAQLFSGITFRGAGSFSPGRVCH